LKEGRVNLEKKWTTYFYGGDPALDIEIG
jgi:hypothetical protein